MLKWVWLLGVLIILTEEFIALIAEIIQHYKGGD